MRQINLLPGEIAERRRARQITMLLAAAGAGLVAVLLLIYLVQSARLAGEHSRLNKEKTTNAALQRKVDALAQFAKLQDDLKAKQDLLGRLTQDEVRWSMVLSDVSMVIPSDVWLTSFSGSVSQAPTGPRPTAGFVIGNVNAAGTTFTHLDVAKWLIRLADVREFMFPYLTLSAKSGEGGQPTVSFNSTFQLSEQSLRRNQPDGVRQ